MKYSEEAVRRATSLLGRVSHLSDESDLKDVAVQAYEGRTESIRVHLEELKRLQYINAVATIAGLVLVFLALCMFLLQEQGLGVASGIGGLLVEFLPLFLGRQIARTRASLRLLLPEYKDLFGLIVQLEVKEDMITSPFAPDQLNEPTISAQAADSN